MLRTEKLYDRVAKHVKYQDLDYCLAYGEPGYSDPERGILFANWNDVPQRIQDVLENNGFALEWSDEWIIDHDAGKAYRSSPDSYSWTPSYVLTEDCEIIGEADYDTDLYIEYLLNDTNRCATFRSFNPADHGFVKFNGEYESGFHPGQNDDPDKVAKQIEDKYPDHDYLFTINGVGQFDTRWSAWIRPQD